MTVFRGRSTLDSVGLVVLMRQLRQTPATTRAREWHTHKHEHGPRNMTNKHAERRSDCCRMLGELSLTSSLSRRGEIKPVE